MFNFLDQEKIRLRLENLLATHLLTLTHSLTLVFTFDLARCDQSIELQLLIPRFEILLHVPIYLNLKELSLKLMLLTEASLIFVKLSSRNSKMVTLISATRCTLLAWSFCTLRENPTFCWQVHDITITMCRNECHQSQPNFVFMKLLL